MPPRPRRDAEQYGDAMAAVTDLAARRLAYAIAIPSYQRHDTIGGRTLATLDRLRVDRDRVTIFTADDAQADAYRAQLDGWRVVVGTPGLHACRTWYSTVHYPAGTRVLNMDDDVDELNDGTTGKLAPWAGHIDAFATIGFGMAEGIGARLWGITAVANAFYMADEAVAGLRYICGIVHGTIAGDPVNTALPALSSGADFERSLCSYRAYGSVVRLGWISPKTVYFAPGGMQAEFGGKEQRAADHAARLGEIAGRRCAPHGSMPAHHRCSAASGPPCSTPP